MNQSFLEHHSPQYQELGIEQNLTGSLHQEDQPLRVVRESDIK